MYLRRNPLGLRVGSDVTVIRVGKRGKQTHIYDPSKEIVRGGVLIAVGAPMCGSGYRGGKPVALYGSDSKMVTCTRCVKLHTMNEARRGKGRG